MWVLGVALGASAAAEPSLFVDPAKLEEAIVVGHFTGGRSLGALDGCDDGDVFAVVVNGFEVRCWDGVHALDLVVEDVLWGTALPTHVTVASWSHYGLREFGPFKPPRPQLLRVVTDGKRYAVSRFEGIRARTNRDGFTWLPCARARNTNRVAAVLRVSAIGGGRLPWCPISDRRRDRPR
jgi:hypothetical protein